MLDPHFPWMGSSHFPFGIIGQIAPFSAQIAVPAPLYILRITAKESPNLGHAHMSRGIGVGTDLAMHGDLHVSISVHIHCMLMSPCDRSQVLSGPTWCLRNFCVTPLFPPKKTLFFLLTKSTFSLEKSARNRGPNDRLNCGNSKFKNGSQ